MKQYTELIYKQPIVWGTIKYKWRIKKLILTGFMMGYGMEESRNILKNMMGKYGGQKTRFGIASILPMIITAVVM